VELPDEPAPVAVAVPVAAPSANGTAERAATEAPAEALPLEAPPRRRWRRHLAGPALLVLALLAVLVHDLLLPTAGDAGPLVVDPEALVEVRFHDGPKEGTAQEMPNPTMRFGVVMTREADPRQPGQRKRLTYDEYGCTNNTCVRVDRADYLFGEPREGRWVDMGSPLPQEGRAWPRRGLATRWLLPMPNVVVTQEVEVVPGAQSHRLDTCLVRYVLHNQDSRPHLVGIRFLLDTFIGANDGVPFTVPGASGLCDTQLAFDGPAGVPDFIQALENDDLLHPGTVAHLQFRVGGTLEAPTRVLLGGWPNKDLQDFGYPQAVAQNTRWEVPRVNMRGLQEMEKGRGRNADPDSAVTMYWDEQQLAPGARREVGFAYGLGTVSSGEGGGRLLLSLGGPLVPGGEFTLTALVHNPLPGERLTLELPPGFRLATGEASQAVPPVPVSATRPTSPVTWRVRAGSDGRYDLRVRSSAGATQNQPVTIRTRGVFD
jgi:hypothetical protein